MGSAPTDPFATHSPCSTPKPSFPSPHQARAHCCRMEGWECVCTNVSVHTRVQGGSALTHLHTWPRSLLLPNLTPALAVCLGLPEPACPCSVTVGSMGLCPHPCQPLLTVTLSPQASGAGCWRAAAGAPSQAPPPLHRQLHQHQVRVLVPRGQEGLGCGEGG